VVASAKEARTDGDLPSAATLLSEALGMGNRSVGRSERTKIYCEGVRNVQVDTAGLLWVSGPYLLVGRTE